MSNMWFLVLIKHLKQDSVSGGYVTLGGGHVLDIALHLVIEAGVA